MRWPDDAVAFGPVGPAGIRVDAGVDTGDAVTGRFDPLLAKVIVHGDDRATALARLGAALDATELLGLPTNLAFLRRLVRLPVVVDGRRDDDLARDRSRGPRRGGGRHPLRRRGLAAAARSLGGRTGDAGAERDGAAAGGSTARVGSG